MAALAEKCLKFELHFIFVSLPEGIDLLLVSFVVIMESFEIDVCHRVIFTL